MLRMERLPWLAEVCDLADGRSLSGVFIGLSGVLLDTDRVLGRSRCPPWDTANTKYPDLLDMSVAECEYINTQRQW
jgi:hypothetical protein